MLIRLVVLLISLGILIFLVSLLWIIIACFLIVILWCACIPKVKAFYRIQLFLKFLVVLLNSFFWKCFIKLIKIDFLNIEEKLPFSFFINENAFLSGSFTKTSFTTNFLKIITRTIFFEIFLVIEMWFCRISGIFFIYIHFFLF